MAAFSVKDASLLVIEVRFFPVKSVNSALNSSLSEENTYAHEKHKNI